MKKPAKKRPEPPHMKPRDPNARADVLIRTSPSERDRLKRIADRNGWSLSAAGDRAIREFNEKYGVA
jgi:hypothetical protein